jgi:hypothetical protein
LPYTFRTIAVVNSPISGENEKALPSRHCEGDDSSSQKTSSNSFTVFTAGHCKGPITAYQELLSKRILSKYLICPQGFSFGRRQEGPIKMRASGERSRKIGPFSIRTFTNDAPKGLTFRGFSYRQTLFFRPWKNSFHVAQ